MASRDTGVRPSGGVAVPAAQTAEKIGIPVRKSGTRIVVRRTQILTRSPRADAVPNPRAFRHVVPQIHNLQSGRLDARLIGGYFDIELKTMAALLGQKLTTVSKTADSKGLQGGLTTFARIATALQTLVGSEQHRRIWLSAPNPQLDGKTPLQAITEGDADIVADLLENMLIGQPA